MKVAIKKLVSEMNKQKSSVKQRSSHQVTRRGKQSLKQMMKEGSQLTNIEITDQTSNPLSAWPGNTASTTV